MKKITPPSLYNLFRMISSVLYLEQFIESLDPLPGELSKSFKDMREMDEKVEQQKALAEKMINVSTEHIFCFI
jgi:hypothetical protein